MNINDYSIIIMAGLALLGLWGISRLPNKNDKDKKIVTIQRISPQNNRKIP